MLIILIFLIFISIILLIVYHFITKNIDKEMKAISKIYEQEEENYKYRLNDLKTTLEKVVESIIK